ncbi:30S ribosomal protein S18 [bacterium]|nr:30S ribosomal protein S18 [bacterium]MCI0566014.1 30S ribosomal protein S18 [bacterium]MCI0679777.1 30S ribosomal protein S18 [bacterium]
MKHVDYKDIEMLKKYVNPHSRILSKKRTGIGTRNQRRIAKAIKRARFMGLLPFVSR